MTHQTLQQVRAITATYQRLLETKIIPENEELLNALEQNKWMQHHVIPFKKHIILLHKKLREYLATAQSLMDDAETRVAKGGDVGRELNKILFLVKNFNDLLFGAHELSSFRTKSEYQILEDLKQVLEKEGFDETHTRIISERLQELRLFSELPEVQHTFDLMYRGPRSLLARNQTHFKVKRGLFTLRRKNVDEIITIGSKNKVHLRIFIDPSITQEGIASTIEQYIESLINIVTSLRKKSMYVVLQDIQLRLLAKKELLAKKRLEDLEEEWLLELKPLVQKLFEGHPELVLTPTFSCQLKIGQENKKKHGAGHTFTAFCDIASTADNYLIHIGIGTLIFMYLISDDFLELFPNLLLVGLFDTVENMSITSSINERTVYEYIKQEVQYRNFSLYTIISHEIQHAFDTTYLQRMTTSAPFTYRVMYQSHQEKQCAYIGEYWYALWQFYTLCRTEAPTQLKEMIIKDKQSYQLLAPINIFATNYAIDGKNKQITNMMKDLGQNKKPQTKSEWLQSDAYEYGFIVATTILLADCKKKNIDLVFLDTAGFQKVKKIFPEIQGMLNGFSGAIPEGTPSWFLLRALQEYNPIKIRSILKSNTIRTYTVNDIPKILAKNMFLLVFKPPYDIVQETITKILQTDEIAFFELYKTAVEILRLEKQLSTPKEIPQLIEPLRKAREEMITKAGFLPA